MSAPSTTATGRATLRRPRMGGSVSILLRAGGSVENADSGASTAGAENSAFDVPMPGNVPPAVSPRMSAAVWWWGGGRDGGEYGGALEPRRAPAFRASSEKSTELSLRAPMGFSSYWE